MTTTFTIHPTTTPLLHEDGVPQSWNGLIKIATQHETEGKFTYEWHTDFKYGYLLHDLVPVYPLSYQKTDIKNIGDLKRAMGLNPQRNSKSNIFQRLVGKTPLETRLKVALHFNVLDHKTAKLGRRLDAEEFDELCDESVQLSKVLVDCVKGWILDFMPRADEFLNK